MMMSWLKSLSYRHKQPGRLFYWTALLLMMTNSSFATDAKPNAQPIRFVTEIMSPFQMKKGHKLSGFAIELIEQVIARSDITARIEVYPWARAYNLALNKPNIFIFTMVKTKERLEQFNWVDEYYIATDSFYALNSRDDIVINHIEDAKKYLTCIPRNDVGDQRLTKLGFSERQLKKVTVQSQCVGMLHRERVDLNLFNELGIVGLAAKLDVKPDFFRRVFVVSQAVMGLAASQSTAPELVDRVRKALKDIKSEPDFQQKIQKWFGSVH